MSRAIRREVTHRGLFDAAIKVFARDGVHASRIEDISQPVGLTRSAFYFHFPSKEHVLLELLSHCESEVVAGLAALTSGSTIRQVFELYAQAASKVWSDGDRSRLLADAFAVAVQHRRAQPGEVGTVRALLLKQFEAAVARGELRASNAATLCDRYLLTTMAAMAAWGARPEGALADVLREVGEQFLEGVLARGPRPALAAAQ